eukprot:1097119_1
MKSFQLYYMFLLVILLFMSADVQACFGLNKRDCRHDGRCIWNKANWYCMKENDVWKGGSCSGLPTWDCKNRMTCRWNRWNKVCGQKKEKSSCWLQLRIGEA